VFYLQAGGVCQTDADCFLRQKTVLGSSLLWPETLYLEGHTSLSDNSKVNPFSGFNHVYVPYCNGDFHLGTKTTATSSGFYYSGHLGIVAILDVLRKEYGMDAATSILLTGNSAGAIGGWSHADWLQGQFPDAKVKLATEAGWFFPLGITTFPYWKVGANVNYGFGLGYRIVSTIAPLYDETCVGFNSTLSPYCWAAGYNFPFISVPKFVTSNIYDSTMLGYLNWVPTDPKSSDFVVYLGNYIAAGIQTSSGPNDGYFLIGCFDHTNDICMGSTTKVQGHTYAQVLSDWFFEKNTISHKVIDECWSLGKGPCHTCPYECPWQLNNETQPEQPVVDFASTKSVSLLLSLLAVLQLLHL